MKKTALHRPYNISISRDKWSLELGNWFSFDILWYFIQNLQVMATRSEMWFLALGPRGRHQELIRALRVHSKSKIIYLLINQDDSEMPQTRMTWIFNFWDTQTHKYKIFNLGSSVKIFNIKVRTRFLWKRFQNFIFSATITNNLLVIVVISRKFFHYFIYR